MARRARKHQFDRRKKTSLIERLFRRRLGFEQICMECSRPYLDRSASKPIETLYCGSAAASIYFERAYGRKRFLVQFGRSAAYRGDLVFTKLVTPDDLADIAEVALMAHHFISEQTSSRRVSHR